MTVHDIPIHLDYKFVTRPCGNPVLADAIADTAIALGLSLAQAEDIVASAMEEVLLRPHAMRIVRVQQGVVRAEIVPLKEGK